MGDKVCMYFEPNKKHTDVNTYLAIKAYTDSDKLAILDILLVYEK